FPADRVPQTRRVVVSAQHPATIGAQQCPLYFTRMAPEDGDLFSTLGVPHAHRVVRRRSRKDPTTIGTERRAAHAPRYERSGVVMAKDSDLLSALGVPHPRGVVGRRGYDPATIRAERRAPHATRVASQYANLLSALGVPHLRGVVRRRSHDPATIG